MARIHIDDLPVNQEMDQQQLKGIFGGLVGDSLTQKVRESSTSLVGADYGSSPYTKTAPGGTSQGIIAILIGL